MNNPFDDASQSGSHSPLDDFIQSLSSDSHSSDSHHHNHNPSDPLDLSHLNLNLGEVHHPHDLNHVGALDGVDHSHHSLMTPAGALDAAYRESLAENKTDLYSESHHQGLVSNSTISHTDHNHYQDSFSSDNHSENVVEFSANSSSTHSGAITKDDRNSVNFVGDEVYWHGYAMGQAGTVDGHKFYRDGHYIGRLGADMNVYDADANKIGYVTPSGKAYTTDDKLFATGGNARWAAATLVFNTCSIS
ncbi:hypothetical protein [Planktothrix agardhii]|jgi:hypothetical protein|uniref:hypothetical protein n=1 Tax=Planktothrix agardhii TaxID=1160 RepID=UPI001D09CE3F|nr:hypothetical protein [Planktothrix agardhii]MCB8784876.1 hypothetical protein [Planktothrix agardhii 1025]MCF3578784.1 hypothetical protein [Planktothrix agardhii 1812]MCF3611039.1 hypothetical protein [Planktothrix agardhii 1027]MCF3644692.1 hypothetical protein [Planktothrix agardhii 1026]MCF3647289.1 hypothetical protein [Planktothrix agardhii 1026]